MLTCQPYPIRMWGGIKVGHELGMLWCKKICCGLLQLGGYGETRENGIDLINPNVKYKDLHTKTTGSLVKHNLYLLLAPPEQGAFQVHDSEATKKGGVGWGRGSGENCIHHQDTIYDDDFFNNA